MTGPFECCPNCGHHDLDPRKILIGLPYRYPQSMEYQEILTLKCQNCGWLGESHQIDGQLQT
jgi:predicted RNA-binding Zn-ribbon protein involved in translation (DUF1610 family)